MPDHTVSLETFYLVLSLMAVACGAIIWLFMTFQTKREAEKDNERLQKTVELIEPSVDRLVVGIAKANREAINDFKAEALNQINLIASKR